MLACVWSPLHCFILSAWISLFELATTDVLFLTGVGMPFSSMVMPRAQKSKFTRSAPSKNSNWLTSASCHEEAEKGCSNMNFLPSAACFRHMYTAKVRCFTASLSCLRTSPASLFSSVKFWKVLNMVHGGEATRSHGFSSSHLFIAFFWLLILEKSHGTPSSSTVVRSMADPAFWPRACAIAVILGGE